MCDNPGYAKKHILKIRNKYTEDLPSNIKYIVSSKLDKFTKLNFLFSVYFKNSKLCNSKQGGITKRVGRFARGHCNILVVMILKNAR